MINIQAYSEQAILVNLDQEINPGINAQILSLKKELSRIDPPGIHFITPAYCSLVIGFDPTMIDFSELKEFILQVWREKGKTEISATRKLKIPVCYSEKYAWDLKELAADKGISKAELIKLHTQVFYQVYMIGFLPGFPYLGKLDSELVCKRKKTPRKVVPANAVGIAGAQTGIYPSESPGGWQIIGRTPLPIFAPERENPCLFNTGDSVEFQAIDEDTFKEIEEKIISKQFDWNSIYG